MSEDAKKLVRHLVITREICITNELKNTEREIVEHEALMQKIADGIAHRMHDTAKQLAEESEG